MATVPTLDDWVAHEKPSAAKLNANIRDVGNFIVYNTPIASACRKLTTQTLALAGVPDQIVFDTVLRDNDNMIDLGTQPKRITIRTAGFYVLIISFPYTDNGTGNYKSFRVNKNGAEILGDVRVKYPSVATVQMAMTLTGTAQLAVNDYLEIDCQHDSTAFVTRTANNGPTLTARWLSV